MAGDQLHMIFSHCQTFSRIRLSNGTNDPYIPLSRSFETQLQLRKMGAYVELDIIPDRPHTIIEQEMEKARTLVLKK
jgi:predicted esterase